MTSPKRRTALVTGAGRGIGKAIALALGSKGFRVALGSRTKSEIDAVAGEIRKSGGEAIGLTLDVTNPASVEAAFVALSRDFGEIDILVNNAGTAKSAPLAKTDLALWNEMLAVNLTSAFLCTKAVLPSMIERGFGRIVNIASVAGLRGSAYISAYAASKHGLVGFTRCVAAEVAGKGVTVNAICPGYVDTELTQKSIENIVAKTGVTKDEAKKRIEAMNPSGRLIQPQEIAALVLSLCGEESARVNGQAIEMNGANENKK